MKKRLGLDTSSFIKLREKNLVYVDKTKWIYKLLTEGECYLFSRPRRFGKSLTISTLKELFHGNKDLFKGLYIYDKWDFKKHPVVIFDFNGINNHTPQALESDIKERLLSYKDQFPIGKLRYASINSLFIELIQAIYKKTNSNVVFLIDEYDKPIIDHLGKGNNELQIAIKNRDILENFLGVLKGANVVDIIQLVFVTGVSRFSKVSIFSKWNNLQDITMRAEFADFLGYTEEELKRYFQDYLEELAIEYNVSMDVIVERLKCYYDGYRFSESSKAQVFNPVSIMYCLQEKNFKSYWFSTGTPSFLVNLIKDKNYYIPNLEHIELSANQLEIFDIEKIKIIPMLFQTGYLTIKDFEENTFILGYPNQEVKTSFNEILLAEISDADTAVTYANKLGKAFKNEKFEKTKYYINAIFSEIPYPHYKKADENYFHTIIYLSLTLIGYTAKTELLSSRGRLDLALIFPDKVYVIEFKCNLPAQNAIEQIKDKKYAERWKNKGIRTILCGINFDTEKKEVREIIFEELKNLRAKKDRKT